MPFQAVFAALLFPLLGKLARAYSAISDYTAPVLTNRTVFAAKVFCDFRSQSYCCSFTDDISMSAKIVLELVSA